MTTTFLKTIAPQRAPVRCAPVRATMREHATRIGQAAGAAVVTLGLTFSANAVTVKLGGDDGSLAFIPSTVTIKSGESVSWVNNAGFPHNVVFDEDEVPDGVNADALSHEEYLNSAGQIVSTKFDTAGSYSYYCEPHQGAGMAGKVIVQ